MKYRTVAVLTAAFALAGCQYKAEPMPIAAYNVYSSYGERLPGKYLLFIDSTALNRSIKPSDLNCAAHSYPIDMRSGFSGSVRKTLQSLVTELEVVDQPVDAASLTERKSRGMIVVKGEN